MFSLICCKQLVVMGARLQFTLLILILLILRINGKSLKQQKEGGTDALSSENLYEIKLNEGENVTDSPQKNLEHFKVQENTDKIATSTIKIQNSTVKTTKKKNKSKKLPKKSVIVQKEDVIGAQLEKFTPEIGKNKRVEFSTIILPPYSKSDDSLTKTLKLPSAEKVNSNFKTIPAWRQYLYDIIELPINFTKRKIDYSPNPDTKLESGIFKKREIKYSITPTLHRGKQIPIKSELKLEKNEFKKPLKGFQEVMNVIRKMDMYISGILKSYKN